MNFVDGWIIDLETIARTATEAGFELKWTEIEVVGPVTRKRVADAEALILTLAGRRQEILILAGNAKNARSNFTEVVRSSAGTGKSVRIRGRAHTHEQGQIAMTITRFEVVEND